MKSLFILDHLSDEALCILHRIHSTGEHRDTDIAWGSARTFYIYLYLEKRVPHSFLDELEKLKSSLNLKLAGD